MKGEGGPRRWIGAFVMHQMHGFKQAWVVHNAMRPVEIGIVDNQCHWDAEKKPPHRIVAEIAVDEGIILNRMNEHACEPKDDEGAK